jgi:hypothetical protein
MPDKLSVAVIQQVLERLDKYAESLPWAVRFSLGYITSNATTPDDTTRTQGHIKDFYGSQDKAPLWLQCISNAQPGHYESAFAEARAHLAAAIQEVSNDEPIVTVTPI